MTTGQRAEVESAEEFVAGFNAGMAVGRLREWIESSAYYEDKNGLERCSFCKYVVGHEPECPIGSLLKIGNDDK